MTGPEDVAVIGATGDVGRGVVRAALERGWRVTAVARRAEPLRDLVNEHPDASLQVVAGSVEDDAGADLVASRILAERPTAVVTAISLPWPRQPLMRTGYDEIATYLATYLGAHLAVSRAFAPRLPAGSLLLGIGGGMADFVTSGQTPVSMAQAAQRMLYRGLHRELRDSGVSVRELMVVSQVNGHRSRDRAEPGWLTDAEIGHRVCEVIADPEVETNAGPILTIRPAQEVRA